MRQGSSLTLSQGVYETPAMLNSTHDTDFVTCAPERQLKRHIIIGAGTPPVDLVAQVCIQL